MHTSISVETFSGKISASIGSSKEIAVEQEEEEEEYYDDDDDTKFVKSRLAVGKYLKSINKN